MTLNVSECAENPDIPDRLLQDNLHLPFIKKQGTFLPSSKEYDHHGKISSIIFLHLKYNLSGFLTFQACFFIVVAFMSQVTCRAMPNTIHSSTPFNFIETRLALLAFPGI